VALLSRAPLLRRSDPQTGFTLQEDRQSLTRLSAVCSREGNIDVMAIYIKSIYI
jgi:hypothetical protein